MAYIKTLFTFPLAALLLAGCQSHSVVPNVAAPVTLQAFADELSARQHFIQPIFPILDCEHVGKISSGEVDEHFYALYFYIDRDQTRTITEQEFIRAANNSTPEKELYIFAQMDTDKDRIVTPREFREFTITTIDASDQDDDGLVSEQEAGFK